MRRIGGEALRWAFDSLLQRHGRQAWWPGDGPFEVMVGAVLTQHTSWTNAERAISNLDAAESLNLQAIHGLPRARLAELIRPSGYFNQKARRLSGLCAALDRAGGVQVVSNWNTPRLRAWLLEIDGIGPETADAMLLYAFSRPVFVIDAYARRIFGRLGWIQGNEPYAVLQALFHELIGADDSSLLNEYHALLVQHGKTVCRPRPRCADCVLSRRCSAADVR